MKSAADYERALERMEGLHASMGILARLQQMLKDPNSDLGDAARLLRSDASLSAQVVRISNSVIYRRGGFSSDLEEAISKVGFNEVLKMVGLALSKGLYFRELRAYGLTARDYWQMSYFSALFMEKLGPRVGMNAGDAYLLGLLHLVGKVVIDSLLADARVEIHWDPCIPRQDWEMLMVGFRYDHAGARLLEKWKFPAEITRRIEKQNAPLGEPPDLGIAALKFTSGLIVKNSPDQPLEEWDLLREQDFWRVTNVPLEDVRSDLARSLDALAKTRACLEHI